MIFYLILAILIGVSLVTARCVLAMHDVPRLALVYVLASVIVIVWCVKALRGDKGTEHPLRSTKTLNLALLIYIGANVVSVIFSVDRTTSFFGAYRRYDGLLSLVVYITLFIIAANFVNKRNVGMLIDTLICACIVCCVVGILQRYGIYHYYLTQVYASRRIPSILGNPVFFSAYLSMVIPLMYYRIFSCRGGNLLRLGLYIFALLLFLTCMVLTGTRSGVIALAISSIVFFVFSCHITRKDVLAIAVFVVLFVIFMGVLGFAESRDIFSRFFNVFGSDRLGLYHDILPAVRENLITGVGYGNLKSVFVYDKAHNELAQHLLCSGILGLGTYIYLITCFSRDVWRFYKDDRLLITTLFCSCLAYFVFVQFNPGHIVITTIFWIIAGTIYGVKNNNRCATEGS